MSGEFRLSIAIPIHNEESVVQELLARTLAVLDGIPGGPHELLLVDDGSTDGTLALLEEGARQKVRKELLELLTLMLAPMTPHLAEELWEMLGHAGGLWTAGWPAFDEALTREDEVEIPVQVNGRLRGKVKVPVGTSGDEVEKLAKADPVIAPHLAGKSIVKRIFVPNKLLNLVVA